MMCERSTLKSSVDPEGNRPGARRVVGQCVSRGPGSNRKYHAGKVREATLAKISKAEISPQPHGEIRFFLEFRSSKVRLFDVGVCA